MNKFIFFSNNVGFVIIVFYYFICIHMQVKSQNTIHLKYKPKPVLYGILAIVPFGNLEVLLFRSMVPK